MWPTSLWHLAHGSDAEAGLWPRGVCKGGSPGHSVASSQWKVHTTSSPAPLRSRVQERWLGAPGRQAIAPSLAGLALGSELGAVKSPQESWAPMQRGQDGACSAFEETRPGISERELGAESH